MSSDLIAAKTMAAPPASFPCHPPYEQMIIKAIVDLNEKKGSSRLAIAKYIKAAFTNLPPTHTDLLIRNIRRLKKKGVIQMVKHSYKLPKIAPRNAKSARGRGRPPKPRSVVLDGPAAPKRGRGRPRKADVGPASVGLSIRPRGRPRKDVLEKPAAPVSGTDAVPPTMPLPSTVKRPRGRPRKEEGPTPEIAKRPQGMANEVSSPAPISTEKRPRGRPRKLIL